MKLFLFMACLFITTTVLARPVKVEIHNDSQQAFVVTITPPEGAVRKVGVSAGQYMSRLVDFPGLSAGQDSDIEVSVDGEVCDGEVSSSTNHMLVIINQDDSCYASDSPPILTP